ncbi:MAG: GGDEF domain-containing protein, partial [Phycisphaeraceae bacterium]
GHAAGDELLVLLGSLLQASTRDDDLACRLGGDEFAVFMPGVSDQRLHNFTQQLTRHFRQQVRAMHPGGPFADLSIGIATMKRDGLHTGQKLLDKADERLYQAKRSGKGRIAGLGTPAASPAASPAGA